MVVVLGLSGRFGEVSLHRTDIRRVARGEAGSASLARMIERIWDRIRDWFCQTRVTEARSLLARLYDSGLPDRDRAAAWFRLRSLVADAWRDRFVEKPEPFGFSLTIDYGADGLLPFSHAIALCNGEHLARRISDELAGAASDPNLHARYQRELMEDLPRADYSIQGELITDLGRESRATRLERYQAVLREKLSPTPEQMRAIETIGYQKVFAQVMQASLDVNGGPFSDEFTQIKGTGSPAYDFVRKGDDIEMHAHFASEWRDLPPGQERFILFREPAIDARLLFLPDGRVTVLSAVVGAAPHGAPVQRMVEGGSRPDAKDEGEPPSP